MSYFNRFKSRFKSILLFFSASFILFATAAWSHYDDSLSGVWYHDGQPTMIRMNGFNQYVFCNENKDCATGFLMGDRDIRVLKWSVTGRISHRSGTIKWSNGTQWSRYPASGNNIDGQWFHNGQPTQIQVYRDNRHFFLTNETGQTNNGFLQGNVLVLPTLNITGYLSPDGTRIRWSNNTTWDRYPQQDQGAVLSASFRLGS